VFLDVQMPECDGFDVLELLGADLPETVVFVTAYAAYALRAFAGLQDPPQIEPTLSQAPAGPAGRAVRVMRSNPCYIAEGLW
jgi:CheY-like chemotaxis protein